MYLGVHGPIQAEDGDKWKVVALSAFVVVRVVRRGDLREMGWAMKKKGVRMAGAGGKGM